MRGIKRARGYGVKLHEMIFSLNETSKSLVFRPAESIAHDLDHGRNHIAAEPAADRNTRAPFQNVDGMHNIFPIDQKADFALAVIRRSG